MDIKTLQYMETRVDRARELISQISGARALRMEVEEISTLDRINIVSLVGKSAEITKHKIPSAFWSDQVLAVLKKALDDYTDSLQQKLDEL